MWRQSTTGTPSTLNNMQVSGDLLGVYYVWSHRCLQLPKIWPKHLTLSRITYWLHTVSQTERESDRWGCLGIWGYDIIIGTEGMSFNLEIWACVSANAIKYQQRAKWSHIGVRRRGRTITSWFDHNCSIIIWIIDVCLCITLKSAVLWFSDCCGLFPWTIRFSTELLWPVTSNILCFNIQCTSS